jgi:hypothetical protein
VGENVGSLVVGKGLGDNVSNDDALNEESFW